jgi:hypothetical protein
VIRRPRIVPEWRRAIRWATVQLGLALTAFGTLSGADQAAVIAWLLDVLRLPPERLPTVLGLLVLLARMVTTRR